MMLDPFSMAMAIITEDDLDEAPFSWSRFSELFLARGGSMTELATLEKKMRESGGALTEH